MEHLSQKLSAHLSSLVPGFEGHWWWVQTEAGSKIICVWDLDMSNTRIAVPYGKICPAWQVEDVLEFIRDIVPDKAEKINIYEVAEKITTLLLNYRRKFAYQKIEEYLWTVLK